MEENGLDEMKRAKKLNIRNCPWQAVINSRNENLHVITDIVWYIRQRKPFRRFYIRHMCLQMRNIEVVDWKYYTHAHTHAHTHTHMYTYTKGCKFNMGQLSNVILEKKKKVLVLLFENLPSMFLYFSFRKVDGLSLLVFLETTDSQQHISMLSNTLLSIFSVKTQVEIIYLDLNWILVIFLPKISIGKVDRISLI